MDGDATHPLIGQLRPIFAELFTVSRENLPLVILKLDYIIEEERDALFHRNAMKSSASATSNQKALSMWLNRQLRELFERPQTQLAGVRVLRSLLTVEYMDLNEMTKLFSELLVRYVLETSDYAGGLEAVDVWGSLLINGSSVVEGIITNCLNFSISLLMRSGHDASFLEDAATHRHGLTSNTRGRGSSTNLSAAASGSGAHRHNPYNTQGDDSTTSRQARSLSRSEGSRPGPSGEAVVSTASVPLAENTRASLTTSGDAASGANEVPDDATKLSGCMFIRELVHRVPSTVVSYVPNILEGLRRAMIDMNHLVRITASDALYRTMRISYRSADSAFCRRWQEVFLYDAQRGLAYGTEVVLLGSLLSFKAVLMSLADGEADSSHTSNNTVVEPSPASVKSIFAVWQYVNTNLSESTQNSLEARKELLNSLPLLARYDKKTFKETTVPLLHELCHRVFTATTGPDDRPLLFLTIAQLFKVLPEIVPPFLDNMMLYVEQSLLARGTRGRCPEAVACFGTLSEVDPNAVRPFLRHVLGPLFAGSITEDFAQNVAKICAAFPELRSTCLSKMLNSIASQLIASRNRTVAAASSAEENRRFVLESLNALSSLDFRGYSTLHFLCDAILRYVTDGFEDVRRSAINLCFQLVLSGCSQSPCELTAAGFVIHHGQEHMRLITTVVRKLVNAAVADPESDIRLHTLERFTPAFDATLALQDIAAMLFPALNDKHQNRLAAVRLLGRISTRNPAVIYPKLRRVMVQCVADIRLFQLPKKQEQATLVLSTLVESAPGMVYPYVPSLLNDCAMRLREPDQPTPVATALLSCIGKLARYVQGDEVTTVANIRPVVVEHILDSSSLAKKQEAIRALGDIIRTTKDVHIYDAHPELLPVLLSALHGGFKETWPVRADVLKLMGIVGAVDPVKVKEIVRHLRDNGVDTNTTDGLMPQGGPLREDVVAQHVVKNVLTVLRLPSLTDEQCICGVNVVANVVALSLRDDVSVGNLSSHYEDIINTVLTHIRNQPKIREKLLRLLCKLAYVLGQHLRPQLASLVSEAVAFLPTAERGVLVEVLCFLSELRRAFREEFRPCLSSILPPLVDAVQVDPVRTAEPVFAFLMQMNVLLTGSLHHVLPCVCDVAANASLPVVCRTSALDAIRHFARRLPQMALHAARCIHCLCRVLKEADCLQVAAGFFSGTGSQPNVMAMETLVAVALDALRGMARNLGSDFDKFSPMVFLVLDHYGRDGQEIRSFIQSAVRSTGRVLAGDNADATAEEAAARYRTTLPPQRRKGDEGFFYLRNVLTARDRESEEDWNLWLKQLSVELLRSSPSYAHGFAYRLAQLHEPFARHMLHSAFAVCYDEMDGQTKDATVALLGDVLRSPRVSSEVLQELLNISEYMERLEMQFNPKDISPKNLQAGLLFDLGTLMGSSERCNLYVKELHYVEIQFYTLTHQYERSVMRGRPTPLPADEWRALVRLCEKSIYLCNLLGLRESAEGMLKYIQENFSFLTGKPASEMPLMMDAQLFEKLQWWSQSLKAYQKNLQLEPGKLQNMVGLMRSLDNLGDYGRLLECWKVFSPRVSRKEAMELAPYGSHAAWLLRAWDDMANITEYMTDEGYVGTTAIFYRAVNLVRKKQFHEAETVIQQCRKRLDSTLSALVAESYDRAYGLFVGIQQLSELEEFAFVAKNPQGLDHWQELWEMRLAAMAYEGWPGTLANHTLMIPPSKELEMWLSFVSMSRQNGRESTSSELLYELLGFQTIRSALQQPKLPQPAVALASFQHLYETNERDEAIQLLTVYLRDTAQVDPSALSTEKRRNLALCHSKLAHWLFTGYLKTDTQELMSSPQLTQIAHYLERATSLDDQNGQIWHTWARFNHSLVDHARRHKNTTAEQQNEYVVCAMDGYLRSVCLSQELEDVLGFLSLFFTHTDAFTEQVINDVRTKVMMVSPTAWLKVIPQIIARMHSRDPAISESVQQLLIIIAKAHPQALLYSLNVTSASEVSVDTPELQERRKAAQRIFTRIAELHHNGRLMVHDAAVVSRELVRCAVLWTELWFDELERAWYQWGKDKSAQNVLTLLGPLLAQLKSPETMAESHFASEFGELLYGAYEYVEKAAASGNAVYMEEAWNCFKTAVKHMDEQINSMSSLALQLVSPKLLDSGTHLAVVVPGQYSESGVFPRIASFQSTLKVMNSKQHPRRLYLNGTDGVLYKFLLKGHEDLRLDERVMQLLAFVNTLLEKHSAVQRRDCLIQVFSVTPLSDNAGLVGWVDHCDTLHQLIREYRVHSKYLSIEVNYMDSLGVDLDRLTVMQHVEPFEFALENTDGSDLANSLWKRAPSAESWLDRRTTYVCSLATMSMVGHILGLGDRHPSNLMIHAFSGRVVHIDFGDCFEVAQTRSAFPEKVPFRLTRMLVKAMEMGGIEGLFRHGCITVMNVLREEGSSILALLEAFVHDPLVSWWREDPSEDAVASSAVSSAIVSAHTTPGRQNVANVAYKAMGESFQRHSSYHSRGAVGSLSRNRSVRAMSVAKAVSTRSSLNTSVNSIHQSNKAHRVVDRIREKLEGREFTQRRRGEAVDILHTAEGGLSVSDQVARLIVEATSNENLCVHFRGWCPFW